jgi:hypothetical protein
MREVMLDSRRNVCLACALSALAGYVDGIGYLHLGGLFVSFMSGNSTRLGVSLAQENWWNAAAALGLGAESAVVGGTGGGFGVRRIGLSMAQSRRDLVCRGVCAGLERDRGGNDAPIDGIDSEPGLPELSSGDAASRRGDRIWQWQP